MVNLTKGTLSTLLRRAIPASNESSIKEALDYARGEDDLVQDIVQTKLDFYASGLAISVKVKNEQNKGATMARIRDTIRIHELHQVAEELIFNLVACDNAILQWCVSKGKLKYVTSLDADQVKYSRMAGKEELKIVLSKDVIHRIRTAAAKDRAEALKVFPEKYIKAAESGKNEVTLSNSDGEYWLVRTRASRFGGLATPTLHSRYTDIIMRQLLIAGDWSVAYLFKRAIELVKSGEKSSGNVRNDPRELYPTQDEIDLLKAEFLKVGQAQRLFTNHTVEISYPHPPKDIFDDMKYEKVEERILRWGGVIDTLMTGKGEGFSQGSLGARRFVSHGHRVRETIGKMIADFILHPSMATFLKLPTIGTEVQVSWNEQNLKEAKQILDELQSLWDRGLLDPQTFHEQLGLKHDQIKDRKKRSLKDKDIWVLTFEPRQGLVSGDTGRPEGDPNKRNGPKDPPKPPKTKRSK